MTYTEISNQLLGLGIEAGLHVHCVRVPGFNVTALYVVPAAWFIAYEDPTLFSWGTYGIPDLRLIGKQQIPFCEVTPDFIRHKVTLALSAVSLP